MKLIQHKIYALLALTGVLVLCASLISSSNQQHTLAQETIASNIKLLADNYFDSINTMMLTGTMANREILSSKLRNHPNIEDAHIIRSPIVNKLYGLGAANQTPSNDAEIAALEGKEDLFIEQQQGTRYMTYLKPMLASSDHKGTNCLGCHQAQEGDVLGVVKISYSLADIETAVTRNTLINTALLSTLFITAFLLLGLLFRRIFIKRLNNIDRMMHLATSNNDLSLKIEDNNNDELSSLANSFNQMISTFKENIAQVSHSSKVLIHSAEAIYASADATEQAILSQKQGTDSVAAAINELESSSNEVKNTTHFASEKSESSNLLAQQSLRVAEHTEISINQLADDVRSAAQQVSQLQAQT